MTIQELEMVSDLIGADFCSKVDRGDLDNAEDAFSYGAEIIAAARNAEQPSRVYRWTPIHDVKTGDLFVHETGVLFRVTGVSGPYLDYFEMSAVSLEAGTRINRSVRDGSSVRIAVRS